MSKGKYPSIFSPQMEAIVFIILILFRNARSFENWGIFSDFPQLENIRSRDTLRPIACVRKDLMDFNWEIFSHVTCLDQSRASEKI